ncbi:MAG: SMP-30/gluconolactonase/LRE family protein, partial [Chthoniobacterales bacterium]
DMKLGILSMELDGSDLRSEVSEYEGEKIRGCNDLYFDSVGNLYFTAPAGSNAKNPVGEVFCRLKKDGRVVRIDEGLRFPNGLAVSSDDRLLVVAETFTRKLLAYHLDRPGQRSSRVDWASFPGDSPVGGDGMDFDGDGHLIATNYGEGELDIFSPDGSLLRRIKLPFAKPSNVHFMGPDSTQLLVTEHENNALWIFDYGEKGQRQYGWSKD